jgi:hypothetical protein
MTGISLSASCALAIRMAEAVMDNIKTKWMDELIGIGVEGEKVLLEIPAGWPGYEPEGTDGTARVVFIHIVMGLGGQQKTTYYFRCKMVHRKNYCWEPWMVCWTTQQETTNLFFEEVDGVFRLDKLIQK